MAAAARQHPEALSLLRSLLQQRAVWPDAALRDAVAPAQRGRGVSSVDGGRGSSGISSAALDELLHLLCYKFKNGE